MKSDDVLNDIELAIAGDWKDIQKEVREKEEDKQWERKIKGNVIVPTYKIFVNLMRSMFSKLYNGEDLKSEPYELYELLKRMFYDSRYSMPEGFSKIWDMFCNHERYNMFPFVCGHCNTVYDVITKRRYIDYNNIPPNYVLNNNIKEYYCNFCGTRIFLREELISMTKKEE